MPTWTTRTGWPGLPHNLEPPTAHLEVASSEDRAECRGRRSAGPGVGAGQRRAQDRSLHAGSTYEGTIRVKLGPINMSYKGKAVMGEIDEATHTARLTASGKDVRGGGTARAGVEMKLESLSASSTSMAVTADVQLTGKVA